MAVAKTRIFSCKKKKTIKIKERKNSGGGGQIAYILARENKIKNSLKCDPRFETFLHPDFCWQCFHPVFCRQHVHPGFCPISSFDNKSTYSQADDRESALVLVRVASFQMFCSEC